MKFNITQHIYLRQGLIFICSILLSATSALSAEAKISDLVIRESQGDLLVDFKIEDYFTEEMQAAVLKGISIRFAFSVFFYEVRDFWLDNKLAEKEELHSIHYDARRKEYKIQRSGAKTGSVVEKDFMKAQKCFSKIIGLEIISLARLKKGSHYQLWVKSEFNDHHFPFLGPLFGFKTDWYTVNFIF